MIILMRRIRSRASACWRRLKPLLEDEKVKVGQNLKYDRGILPITTLSCAGLRSIPCSILHSTAWRPPRYGQSFRPLALKHKTITFEEIAGKGKNVTFNQIALEELVATAAEDADVTPSCI